MGSLHVYTVFSTICGTLKNKEGPFSNLEKLKWASGPFEDQKEPISGKQVLFVSVVLSVSV